MADWSSQNITLTAKGASALSKVQAGSGSLTITRVVASEQYVAESVLREVTSLSSENLPLTIIDRHEVQDGGSVIQVQLSNLYLGKAFTLNEIGVFATHSDNPSEEFLYIIAQVDAETGDKIPLYATTPVTATYDIYLYNVGADNVQITISSAGLVTYEALNKACDIIQRNTAYEVGDILHSHSLKKGLSIKCTVAGTTKSTDTDLSHKEVGDTVEDGTSQWVVIAPSTTADFDAHNHSLDAHPELVAKIIESGGVNVIKRSYDYAKGDIAYSNKIPSWAFLECTVPGTSSDGWYFPEPSEIKVNDTIVDGTVTWKVRKIGSGSSAWFRQASTVYAVGDMRCYESLPYGWYLECTTAGTTGGGDITLPSPIAEKDTVTDGTVVWTIRKLTTVEIPNASSTVAGIMKLYSSKGTNTDGAMTQQAITNELGSLGSLIGTGGGIITENLANNGYIKFANGLIIQWKKSSNKTGTFPISFSSSVYVIVALSRDSDPGLYVMSRHITNSNYDFGSASSSIDFIAIGK